MNERLNWRDSWSPSLWLFLLLMNFSFALALWAAFDTKIAAVDFIGTLVATALLAWRTPLKLSIADGWFYAGKAKIEVKYLGEMTALNKDQMSLARTREVNVDAYLDLRFWVPKGIKLELIDSRDYTPYWLLSTNKAEEILSALKKSN